MSNSATTTSQAAIRRGTTVTHTCAAVGCQASIHLGLLMCLEHWRMVPARLRTEVRSAYWLLGRRPDAQQRYGHAVQAAVDAVHRKAVARKGRADDAQTSPLF